MRIFAAARADAPMLASGLQGSRLRAGTMKILITGGAGFIGSHLSERLIAEGHEVTVLDDLSTGRIENLAAVRGSNALRVVEGTILDEELVDDLARPVDVIFHMAAAVGVKLIMDEPSRSILTNVRGTEIVLNAALKRNTLTFVASTSEVYGKGVAVPFREDADLVLGPTSKHRWAYACSKALDEFLALAHWRERKQPVTVVRLFNTVGPRQTGRYGMVVPRFVQQALAGDPITVYGDGTQSRCFTYVGDVVRALIALAGEPRAIGEVVNVGNTEEVTIGELAVRVRDLAGSRSPIVHVAYEQAYDAGFEDMPRRVPDIGKIRALIGFEPKLCLSDILQRVIAHERRVADDWRRLVRAKRREKKGMAAILPAPAASAAESTRRRAVIR
jgi:UDP-glucose 4-epimerase